jgi:hypothetical protein
MTKVSFEVTEDRSALHAYLSPDAHRAWQQLSEDNGVSVTGMLEAIGNVIKAEIFANDGDADGIRPDWVKAGRKIDALRRRRG